MFCRYHKKCFFSLISSNTWQRVNLHVRSSVLKKIKIPGYCMIAQFPFGESTTPSFHKAETKYSPLVLPVEGTVVKNSHRSIYLISSCFKL